MRKTEEVKKCIMLDKFVQLWKFVFPSVNSYNSSPVLSVNSQRHFRSNLIRSNGGIFSSSPTLSWNLMELHLLPFNLGLSWQFPSALLASTAGPNSSTRYHHQICLCLHTAFHCYHWTAAAMTLTQWALEDAEALCLGGCCWVFWKHCYKHY